MPTSGTKFFPYKNLSHCALEEKAATMDGLSVLLDNKQSEYRDSGVFHQCASHGIWDTMATCHQHL